MGEAAAPLLELGGAAMTEHQTLSDSLLVVEAPGLPHQRAAGRPAPRALRPAPDPRRTRDALARRGHTVCAALLKRDMLARRALARAPGDRFTIGRPAQG
ncbi:hypothetical protein [Streptomyces sp. NPDC002205]|uniref:hypothetical protein n=1 Tax=Streptomyces sp. NPDC002205 TaxID=3154411 RepID=UPI0033293C33